MEEDVCVNPVELQVGDVVYYLGHENGVFCLEQGTVKEENYHVEGVQVHGEVSEKFPKGWKQYVSKWFIQKVVRNGAVIFQTNSNKQMEEAK